MPHVSSKELDVKTLEKIFRRLITLLERAQGKQKFALVMEELLTQTEKIMLAKRLAIVLMLSGDIPQHRIADALLVSHSTVTRIALQVEIGKYDSIRSISRKEKTDLEKIVWLLLTAGGVMPPRIGGKYWRKKYRKS